MYSAATLVHRHSGNVTLVELNDDLFPLHVPALVFVAISMAIGIVGNIFVIVIYKMKFRRSNHRYFILFLAVVDLLACCTGMPFLIASLRLPYLMTSNVACKSIRFFHYFVNNTSGLLLVVIAIERFRKICRPFKSQMTTSHTLLICWGVVVFSIFMATPAPMLYSASPIETGIANLTGHQCYASTDSKGYYYFSVYMMVLLFETIVCIFIFGVLYAFIIRTLWKSDQFIQAMRSTQMSSSSSRTCDSASFDAVDSPSDMDSGFVDKRKSLDVSEASAGVSSKDITQGPTNVGDKSEKLIAVTRSQIVFRNKNAENCNDNSDKPLTGEKQANATKRLSTDMRKATSKDKSKDKIKRAVSDTTMNRVGTNTLSPVERLAYTNVLTKNGRKRGRSNQLRTGKHSKTTARVTIMLFTVSMFFVIAFVPHLVLMIVASTDKNFLHGLSEVGIIVFQLFLRIFIINNVVNPIIYLVFDSKFRRISSEFFTRKCCKQRELDS